MSRIPTAPVQSATGDAALIFEDLTKSIGSVPNLYAAVGSLDPAILKSYLAADAALASGTLSTKDIETIKVIVSEATGCHYCLAAHHMLGKAAGLSSNELKNIRTGEPTGDAKRDALVKFVRLLQQSSGTVGQHEFDAIKAAGYDGRQLVEISFAMALTIFTNAFNRINDTIVDFPPVY
jgi:uncharacterized peroxidase-related enzyme